MLAYHDQYLFVDMAKAVYIEQESHVDPAI